MSPSHPAAKSARRSTFGKFVVFASFLLAAIALSSGASADIGERLPKLARLASEVVHAGSPYAYVPLRQIWAEWDQGDPADVQATLASLAEDRSVAPPVRAYAGLLEAYALRRRGDLTGARKKVANLGYVGRWIVTGPFDNEGKAGFDRVFGPEEDLADPLSMTRTYDGKERTVQHRMAPDAFPFGWVDLGALVRPQENVCAFATTFVRDAKAKRNGRPFSLWYGSAGASKVYFDGVLVAEDGKYRDLDADRFGVPLVMREGWHRLTIKVCGEAGGTMFALRLAGPDGAPNRDLEADASPTHAKEAASGRFRKGEGALAKKSAKVPTPTGPVAAFEKAVAKEDPRALEAYARWLTLTSSDDPAENRARDLARRAAEKAPTIARALLAGELAENRNQRAVWVSRAEALVKPGTSLDDRVKVLLARAMHTRGGINFRDAIPQFDKVLAIDPDNVTAHLARVELYSAAGLRETALATLEQALTRRPRSTALLRATGTALRDLDRTTEAGEITDRYAQLRFDDTSIMSDRIDLAIARRDAVGASRWVERLLETNPDSTGALAIAADTYASLGDRAKGIAMFRRALDLAPEDVPTLRRLADLYGLAGQTDEQLRLLKKVLDLRPQDKDVREYVAHAGPAAPRADEAYARPAKEFLAQRSLPSQGKNRRTLVDLQVTTVFPNGLSSRFHQVVFQPLTDAAAAQAREYGFAFEADTETVQLRGARIYRKDGTVDEAIESGEGDADDPSMAMYTSARSFYVHFPRLSPGDVVELLYRVEDIAQRNAFADYFGEVVYMQSTESIGRAEYVLITPNSRTFYFNEPRVPGLTKTTTDKGDQRIFRFVAENVPAADPEPLSPPLSEVLGHVHVSTYKSWDDMGRWYWGLVKDQFTADDELRQRVAEITQGLTDDKAKIRAVYDFVVQKTRYVALEFGIHGFKPYRCAQIFARGFGDCKDKATLIVTMLKELGIPATIVIVRTGLRGNFETSPASLAPFDHAIAYVPSENLYLDGTAEWTGSTELPSMDRGALALQINEGKPKLVHLPDPPASESVLGKRVEATVGARGEAQVSVDLSVTGAPASAWRQRYHAPSTQRQRVQEDLASDMPGLEIAEVQAKDVDDIEKPVEISAKGRASNFARKDGDTWRVPVGAKEFAVASWASLSRRRSDLRILALTTRKTESIVHLPQGASVVSNAKPSSGSSPFGTFSVEVARDGERTVRVETKVALTKGRISVAEYPAFRAFCEQIDRALGQSLAYTVAK